MSQAKLYVGNLSYSATEENIRELFGAHGEVVSVALINDRDTGRPKGFGFVQMSTPDQAGAAREALDGAEHLGRTLKVDHAKEQQPRSSAGRDSYGRGGRW